MFPLLVNATTVETAEDNNCSFSQKKLDKYKADNDFKYVETEENKADLYDSYGQLIKNIIARIFGNRAAGYILSNFHYIILGIAIIILIVYFRRIHMKGIKFSRKKDQETGIIIQEEVIEELDFEALISEAISKGNFKIAIRYNYLNLLKQLSVAEMIKWELHKTNFDYFLEIKNEETKNSYRRLSVLFEYIWYGKGVIDEQQYESIASEFKEFKVIR